MPANAPTTCESCDIEDRHLGDGVYATWTGSHVLLYRTGNWDHVRIALTRDVLAELIQFRAALDAAIAKAEPPEPSAEVGQ